MPIRGEELEGKEFANWSRDCTFIENTPASNVWAREHWADIQAKKHEYLPKWELRNDKPTLRAGDGR